MISTRPDVAVHNYYVDIYIYYEGKEERKKRKLTNFSDILHNHRVQRRVIHLCEYWLTLDDKKNQILLEETYQHFVTLSLLIDQLRLRMMISLIICVFSLSLSFEYIDGAHQLTENIIHWPYVQQKKTAYLSAIMNTFSLFLFIIVSSTFSKSASLTSQLQFELFTYWSYKFSNNSSFQIILSRSHAIMKTSMNGISLLLFCLVLLPRKYNSVHWLSSDHFLE